jgi:recombination protein RecA
LVSAKSIQEQPKRILNVSPCFDFGAGGGISEGTMTLLCGAPKCGKTSLALHISKKAQQLGKHIYWLDVEHRLKTRDLSGIPDLDLERFTVISSKKGKILSAQDFLNIASHIVNNCYGSVLVIDSFSGLCSEDELAGTMEDQQRADVQKLLKKWCRKSAGSISINNMIVISMVHIMANVTGYGKKTLDTGGYGINYHSDNKLSCTGIEYIEDGIRKIGQNIKWTFDWANIAAPGSKVENILVYGKGIDEVAELVKLSIDFGLIVKGGAWFTYGEQKIQGESNVVSKFKEDPELLAKLQKDYNTLMGHPDP